MAPAMHTLIDLVIDFGRRYEKVKIDRGIVDFSDLEHYALRILSIEKTENLYLLILQLITANGLRKCSSMNTKIRI